MKASGFGLQASGTWLRAFRPAVVAALLVDRFKFTFHRETRQVDGFVLVRSHPERLVPQLRVSEVLQVVVNKVAAPVRDETGLTGSYE
jgi:hypothetical protein